jgi:hypothetical protein
MRSRPCKEFTPRERLASMRWSLQRCGAPAPAPIRRIALLVDGHVRAGQDTQHRTPEARRWRTMLRLRRQRNP